jgi:hypothetical protein
MNSTEKDMRDGVLSGRVAVAAADASALLAAMTDLMKNPPAAGSDQEERMRFLETAIAGALYNANRLKGWVKT